MGPHAGDDSAGESDRRRGGRHDARCGRRPALAVVVAAMVKHIAVTTTCAVALLAAFGVGCGGNRYVPPPPSEVTVAHPIERELTTYDEFSGHTVAVAVVEIRARV